MSTALTRTQSGIPALQLSEDELVTVLQSSVYPGAKLESIKLVVGVCKASGKDPLKKPYHIVPMPFSTGRKDSNGYDIKEMRDVIMPGINDYRTDAARTGEHAGTSEPEFGPDVTELLGDVEITYPKWCRVVVKRQMPSGLVVEYPAKEFWKENYATKGSKTEAPNAMWKKRPYAQLAKCAEAQALRKGFPEVGNQPTADEMEGKELDMGAAEVVSSRPAALAVLPAYPDADFEENLPKWLLAIHKGRITADQVIARSSSKYTLSEVQKAAIRKGGEPANPADEVIDADFVAAYEGAER